MSSSIETLRSSIADIKALQDRLSSMASDSDDKLDEFKSTLNSVLKAAEAALNPTMPSESKPVAETTSGNTSSTHVGNTSASPLVEVASAPASSVEVKTMTDSSGQVWRVFDPGNPSAFVEPSNPGGGPNYFAPDLVFNPDPMPPSPVAPSSVDGKGIPPEQIKAYEEAQQALIAWNEKNWQIKDQILQQTAYAPYLGYRGPKPAPTISDVQAGKPASVSALAGAGAGATVDSTNVAANNANSAIGDVPVTPPAQQAPPSSSPTAAKATTATTATSDAFDPVQATAESVQAMLDMLTESRSISGQSTSSTSNS